MTHRLLPKPDAGADDTSADDTAQFKWEFDEDLDRCFVSLPVDQ